MADVAECLTWSEFRTLERCFSFKYNKKRSNNDWSF